MKGEQPAPAGTATEARSVGLAEDRTEEETVRRLTVWIVSLSLFGAYGPAQAAEPPRAVSPGALDRVTSVVGACPTFSWSAGAGARGYEIVVYRLSEEGLDGPVRRIEVPAGATSWTPSAEECLAPRVSHAWLVRSVTDGGPGAWSEPALFEIAAGPSTGEMEAAIETLRRYLAGEREDAGEIGAQAPGAAPAGSVEAIDEWLGEEALDLPARHDRPGTVPPALRSDSHATAVAKDVPAASSTPSLTVSDQIHLGADSDLFKDGNVFLWDDMDSNLALGRDALASATGDATSNTAVGRGALANTTGGDPFEGSMNTAVGDSVLLNNTTGKRNTGSGAGALFSNTTGYANTASGYGVLVSNTTGYANTAHGMHALSYNTTGSRNVAIGHRAGRNLGNGTTATGLDDNIFIAHEGSPEDSGVIRIGTLGTQTEASIAGDRVGLGTEIPGNRLHVTDSIDGTEDETLADHVARIDNSSSDENADVLALRVANLSPETSQNFITFFDSQGAIAAIEGNNTGGVTYKTSGADFAEYLPKADPGASFQSGEVVGVRGGEVVKGMAGAERVLVVTSSPLVLGNHTEGSEESSVAVAFLGQAPVKLRGSAEAGDLLVASSAEAGVAEAVAAADLRLRDLPRIVGRVLEGADAATGQTLALVGLPDAAILATLLEARDARLVAQEAEITELRRELKRDRTVTAETLALLRAEMAALREEMRAEEPRLARNLE